MFTVTHIRPVPKNTTGRAWIVPLSPQPSLEEARAIATLAAVMPGDRVEIELRGHLVEIVRCERMVTFESHADGVGA